MKKGYQWDIATRTGALPDAGGQIVVHEFDYMARERGRLPGERCDDPLLAGDPQPRRLGQLQPRVERAQVRLRWRHLSQQVVHEVRGRGPMSPRTSASCRPRRWPSTSAGTSGRRPTSRPASTPSPKAFGKVMSELKPRLAVGYHSVQSPENNASHHGRRCARRTTGPSTARARPDGHQRHARTTSRSAHGRRSTSTFCRPTSPRRTSIRAANRREVTFGEGPGRQVAGLHAAADAGSQLSPPGGA